jgi:hypothetical protein
VDSFSLLFNAIVLAALGARSIVILSSSCPAFAFISSLRYEDIGSIRAKLELFVVLKNYF